MERALRLDNLRNAIGSHPIPPTTPAEVAEGWTPTLPTPEELQSLLAETEVQLFINQRALPPRLIRTAWYLHGVASASPAASIYTADRQRDAFGISAHIFDLALLGPGQEDLDNLRQAFAAQVGYYRSDKQPNATAIGRRASGLILSDSPIVERMPSLALEAGVAFLGMNLADLWAHVRAWRQQLSILSSEIEIPNLVNTLFGPTYCVVEAVAGLLTFLTRGDRERLNTAQSLLDIAVQVPEGDGDHDARWVAAHLRFIADEMDAGSIWTTLPPDVPGPAKQAFTLTSPTVLTLWRPQRDLLTTNASDGGPSANALSNAARRVVLSIPTSAGKTLMSQLIMLGHLATTQTDVCYVAPQRSLGREVRRDLARRLRFISRTVGGDVPDFGFPMSEELQQLLREMNIPSSSLFMNPLTTTDADVTVVTPEALATALRDDPDGVLDRYGLFIFDEAHLLAERSRGFKLEATLAYLHWRTKNTPHRLVLLSAALGNAGQVSTWLDVDSAPVLLQSDWRGPRRLHAIFNTDIDWTDPTVSVVDARQKTSHLTRRYAYRTFGTVRLRVAAGRQYSVTTTNPLGVTCFRATANGVVERKAEKGKGTPYYKMLADIVRHVGHAGPVLVIRSTRKDAARMAAAIASELPLSESTTAIAGLARARLGSEHPLPQLLDRGVAYHHAGLPVDLQEAIEEAVRDDIVRFVVATSTLTEGVNLPVRTVVLAPSKYDNQPEEQQLTGARLVNAMGRAGRATKESEGWVILQLAAKPQPQDFAKLEPGESDLEVRSRLMSESALEALAVFEESIRSGEDAIYSAVDEMSDFVSFIWFVLAAEEELTGIPPVDDPFEAFTATLAYSQMPEELRTRYRSAIQAIDVSYRSSDPVLRRRWARSGTSIRSARALDDIAHALASVISSMGDAERDRLQDYRGVLDFLESMGVFETILELPDRPRLWEFHTTTSSRSPTIEVRPAEVLDFWLTGSNLAEIGDRLLAGIPDRSRRLELAVDCVTDFCEHYFSWTVGVLIRLTNARLSDRGYSINADLSLFIRYGVDNSAAAEMRMSGVRSRELASGVVRAAHAQAVNPSSVRDWLRSMTVSEWEELLGTGSGDLTDLLDYCEDSEPGLLRTLLAEGAITLPVISSRGSDLYNANSSERAPCVLRRSEQKGLVTDISVWALSGNSSGPLAFIPVRYHNEIDAVLSSGINISIELAGNQLRITDLPD